MTKKRDRWIGSAQVLIDANGYARAVVIHESAEQWVAIGPVGTVKAIHDRTYKTESIAKRVLEKELKDAGY